MSRQKAEAMPQLSLFQWQARLEQFKRENWEAPARAAFRIDNTPFSTARHYGGFTMNGYAYTVFPFADGALLAVREDMLRWLRVKLRDEASEAKKEARP